MATLHRARPPRAASTRQVVAAALVLLVLGGLGAILAGRAGASFRFDLEEARPALATVPPAIVDPHTQPLARRVFLVIVDCLRLDTSRGLPLLDALRRRGVDGQASSHYPTWSRPNYVSILAGVPPEASGVRTNHHATPVTLDTLMDRVRAAGMTVGTATDYDALPMLFLRPRAATGSPPPADEAPPGDDEVQALEAPLLQEAAVAAPDANLVSPFDEARYAPWPGGFAEAGSALTAGHDALVVLLVGAVDAAGHAHGAASPRYREAAESADRALARALARVDLAHDAVIVTADHGHTDRGGHGGVEPEVVHVPLVAAGAGIRPGAVPVDAHLVDIAPTVAALLGVPAPGHGLGRTLTEILELDPGAQAARHAADAQRLKTTRAVVARAEAHAAAAVAQARAVRLAIVLGGVLLACGLAWLLIRRCVLRLDLRVMLVSVPAFFVVYYGLIGTLGQRFSQSLLPAQGHLAWQMAKYGIAAMIAQLVASLWALRHQGNLAQRLAAANGVAWAGLLLAMVPAGLCWAFFPAPYVTVPGPFWLVVIPAVEVAVACIALDVALTLMVEVIVFAARAYQRTPVESRAPGTSGI